MRNLTKNLRDEWNIFRQKYKKTQAQASLELGWSASLFNQFLCGRRPVNSEHIIKISNYFDISPDAIDPQFNPPKRSKLPTPKYIVIFHATEILSRPWP